MHAAREAGAGCVLLYAKTYATPEDIYSIFEYLGVLRRKPFLFYAYVCWGKENAVEPVVLLNSGIEIGVLIIVLCTVSMFQNVRCKTVLTDEDKIGEESNE